MVLEPTTSPLRVRRPTHCATPPLSLYTSGLKHKATNTMFCLQCTRYVARKSLNINQIHRHSKIIALEVI